MGRKVYAMQSDRTANQYIPSDVSQNAEWMGRGKRIDVPLLIRARSPTAMVLKPNAGITSMPDIVSNRL